MKKFIFILFVSVCFFGNVFAQKPSGVGSGNSGQISIQRGSVHYVEFGIGGLYKVKTSNFENADIYGGKVSLEHVGAWSTIHFSSITPSHTVFQYGNYVVMEGSATFLKSSKWCTFTYRVTISHDGITILEGVIEGDPFLSNF